MNIPARKTLSAALVCAATALSGAAASAATFAQSAGPEFAFIESTNETLTLLDVTGTQGEVVDLAAVLAAASSGSAQITAIYLGPNAAAWDPAGVNFLSASGGASLAEDGTALTSLWLAVDGALFTQAGGIPSDITFGSNTVSFEQFGSKVVSGEVIVVRTPAGVIPLPAAGWMLLSALAGLGVLARRRKAA